MFRQLGKATLFFTFSAAETAWPDLLRILYKLKYQKEYSGNALIDMDKFLKSNLVNEDPVTCVLYFEKLIDTFLNILQSPQISSFRTYSIYQIVLRELTSNNEAVLMRIILDGYAILQMRKLVKICLKQLK